jgi:tRNA uridine 5-carbamoylmethylation protein Kti12
VTAGTNLSGGGAVALGGSVTVNVVNAPTFSGNATAAGFFQSSKRSLKTNIVDFEKDALDIIKKTKIVEFYYLTDLGNKHIGFIADDTPEELATKSHDTMDTNSTLAVALRAIQQLEARVIELEKQLASK